MQLCAIKLVHERLIASLRRLAFAVLLKLAPDGVGLEEALGVLEHQGMLYAAGGLADLPPKVAYHAAYLALGWRSMKNMRRWVVRTANELVRSTKRKLCEFRAEDLQIKYNELVARIVVEASIKLNLALHFRRIPSTVRKQLGVFVDLPASLGVSLSACGVCGKVFVARMARDRVVSLLLFPC